ncbi:MAG: NTP transferase domain-containing protein [Candidatus Nitricoxidivorans perseverans]|uniref:NTP transferase domain-containing protein n=1 Tax=Candidatus Nitricoxidivorans perseverans TaxID=2975601 RepID=A0AA49FK87_9PROT|nr:MAG: NTP transferase domain-containing protein [Candidatus Nitricoxidivorans perseverans]
MKVVATIEARTGSTRLPAKVLRPILGQPMLGRIIERVGRSRRIDEIVVATTRLEQDAAIAELAGRYGVSAYRGSEEDILDRLFGAVEQSGAGILVSLTGDNPFIDPALVDDMVDLLTGREDVDYVATTHMQHADHWSAERTFPTGVTAQVLYADMVREQHAETADQTLRNLGLFTIYNRADRRYRLHAMDAAGKYAGWRHPELRMTVDTPEDFELATQVYERLYPGNAAFSTGEAITLIAGEPLLRDINRDIRQRLGHEEASRRTPDDAKGAG